MFQNTCSDFFQTSSGIKLFYQTNFKPGKMPTHLPLIVFHYGLVCNFTHYEKQLPYFDELGFPILIYNYRAHYNSTGSIESCNFEQLAKDAKELIDHFTSQKVFMIGHSMGVNVSLEFAKVFPKKLLGMILIAGTVVSPLNVMFNTTLMAKIIPSLKSFNRDYPDLFKKFWTNTHSNPIMKKIVHMGGFNTEFVPEEFVSYYLKRIGELPPELFYHLLELMHHHDIKKYLSKLQTPTLLMAGDKDKVIPYPLQIELKNSIPKCQFYIIKDGSHVPQLDFPESINERINLFLQTNLLAAT